jgi:hypothetical protein
MRARDGEEAAMGELFRYRTFTVVTSPELEKAGLDTMLRFDGRVHQRIRNSLDQATAMVSVMLQALEAFRNARPTSPESADTGLALRKYFQLIVDGMTFRYWGRVEGIQKVYQKIETGLGLSCPIVLMSAGGKVVARVATDKTAHFTVSPIRSIFNFQSEWQHKPWVKAVGDIELDVGYVLGAPEDNIARTIVHEASHKFAQTKDVLYKDVSFGQRSRETLAEAIEMGDQQVVTIPGRTKKLLPLSGYERSEDAVISADRLLENADSYAWAARRIWKHRTGDGQQRKTA